MTRPRNQRGVAFPSPVVILSIIAVAMAGVAYVATRDQAPTEREVTTVATHRQSQSTQSGALSSSTQPTGPQHLPTEHAKPIKKKVQRGDVYVEVYNNSGITGLAGRVAGKAGEVGWKVVGSDNWYGTIVASTVYYPAQLKAAAKLLALDLGIHRVEPATGPMRRDRLTVILTADAA